MERSDRWKTPKRAFFRRTAGGVALAVLTLAGLAAPNVGFTPAPAPDRHGMEYFRREMWRTVRADHPAMRPVAAAIRAITRNPLEQLVLVNDVSHLLVDYDDDVRVYGREDYHATLDEMIERRRRGGWAYLRDDCDGRAVFAAHLLAALGIQWRFEASYWKEHAWVVARVDGIDYDILDLRKNARETDRLAYKLVGRWFVRPSRRPPPFDWRDAWASRTHRDLQIGLTLGMLTLDSTDHAMHSRHAMDWTRAAGCESPPPPDPSSALLAGVAGFPYGEPLFVDAVASFRPDAPAAPSDDKAPSTATGAN